MITYDDICDDRGNNNTLKKKSNHYHDRHCHNQGGHHWFHLILDLTKQLKPTSMKRNRKGNDGFPRTMVFHARWFSTRDGFPRAMVFHARCLTKRIQIISPALLSPRLHMIRNMCNAKRVLVLFFFLWQLRNKNTHTTINTLMKNMRHNRKT